MAEQDHWRFCRDCCGLFFDGFGFGKCPAGGGEHDSVGSWMYVLAHDVPKTATLQDQWRWCPNCAGLFFEGFGPGTCSAGGGHTSNGSSMYLVPHDVPQNDTLQPQWRWCPNCAGLFFEGFGPGTCPAGGGHTSNGSLKYLVPHISGTQIPIDVTLVRIQNAGTLWVAPSGFMACATVNQINDEVRYQVEVLYDEDGTTAIKPGRSRSFNITKRLTLQPGQMLEFYNKLTDKIPRNPARPNDLDIYQGGSYYKIRFPEVELFKQIDLSHEAHYDDKLIHVRYTTRVVR